QRAPLPIPSQLAPSPVSGPSPVQAPSPYIYTVGANNSYSTSQPIGLIESVTKDIVTLKPPPPPSVLPPVNYTPTEFPRASSTFGPPVTTVRPVPSTPPPGG